MLEGLPVALPPQSYFITVIPADFALGVFFPLFLFFHNLPLG